MNVICFIMLFGVVTVDCCAAFDGVGNWTDTMPQIRVHDAFYPHPHLRDVKAAAKRGKILVITLVVSAGLVAFVSTAIVRSDKKKEEADATENISPAELRARVIAAAIAGREGLMRSREHALRMAFSAYASTCQREWENGEQEHPSSITTYNIGRDRVTVDIPGKETCIEVRAIRGSMGASATADKENGSIRSSIFTAHAMDRKVEV